MDKERKEFLIWLAKEIHDEYFEINKEGLTELTCRKLVKLGVIKEEEDEDGTYYAYDIPAEEDIEDEVDDLIHYIAENICVEGSTFDDEFTQDIIATMIDLGIIIPDEEEESDG